MISTYRSELELLGVPPSFRQWQKRCQVLHIPPVVAVAGSRGKSTVVRLLQAIYNEARIQSAIWTDFGVEINGRRQAGEIAGWNRALARLTESSLDVAVQELDWNLVAAVGLPAATYPIAIVTNLCANNDDCLGTPEGQIALRAVPRIANAVHSSGVMCLNGEDYSLQRAANGASARFSLAARSHSSPVIRNSDGKAPNVWIDADDHIVCGSVSHHEVICAVSDVPMTHAGTASFEVTNALLATSAAISTGIGIEIVRKALVSFQLTSSELPGSFNVMTVGTVRAVVDRVMPSWFLRPILRAANPRSVHRQITIIGGLETIPADDVFQVGRLLGRTHGAVIYFGDADDSTLTRLKRGLSGNEYPPVFVHLPTERRAINKAMQAVRSNDVLLFLTHLDPGPALRAVARMSAR